jgi:hypothetical protein
MILGIQKKERTFKVLMCCSSFICMWGFFGILGFAGFSGTDSLARGAQAASKEKTGDTPPAPPTPAPPTPVRAARVVISGSNVVASGGSIFLNGTQSASDRPLKWTVVPPVPILKLTDEESGLKSAVVLALNPPDGLYRFKCVAVTTGGTPETTDADCGTILIAVGNVPLPNPNPGPVPPGPPNPGPVPPGPPNPPNPPNPGPVPPGPIQGRLHATLLIDPNNLNSNDAFMGLGTSFKATLEGFNTVWRRYNKDQPEVAATGFNRVVGPNDYPVVVVQDDNGDVVKTLPKATEGSIIDLLKKLRGQ